MYNVRALPGPVIHGKGLSGRRTSDICPEVVLPKQWVVVYVLFREGPVNGCGCEIGRPPRQRRLGGSNPPRARGVPNSNAPPIYAM